MNVSRGSRWTAMVADGREAALLPRHRHPDRVCARLEIGDFPRFQRPARLSSWLGLVPCLDQSGESRRLGAITNTGSGYARRLLVEAGWHYIASAPDAGTSQSASRASRPCHPDRPACPASPLPPPPAPPRTRQTRQRQNRRRRPRTRLLPLGRRRGRLTPTNSRLFRWAPGQTLPGTRDSPTGNPHRPRPFLESARPATQTRAMG